MSIDAPILLFRGGPNILPFFTFYSRDIDLYLGVWDTRDGDSSPDEVSGTSTSTQGRLGRRLYTCFITQEHRLQPGDAWGSDSSLMLNTGDIDQIPLEGRQYLPRNWRKITWIIL